MKSDNQILTNESPKKRSSKKLRPPSKKSLPNKNIGRDEDKESLESSNSPDSEDLLEDLVETFPPGSQNRPSDPQKNQPEFVINASQPQLNEPPRINHNQPAHITFQGTATHTSQMLPMTQPFQPILIIPAPYNSALVQPTTTGQYFIQPNQLTTQIPWQNCNQQNPMNIPNGLPASDPRVSQQMSNILSINPTQTGYYQPYPTYVGINYVPTNGPIYIPATQSVPFQGYDGSYQYIPNMYPQNHSTSFNTIQHNVYNNINNFRPIGLVQHNNVQKPHSSQAVEIQKAQSLEQEMIPNVQSKKESKLDTNMEEQLGNNAWESVVGGAAEENFNSQPNENGYENIDAQEKAKNKLRRPSIDELVYSTGERKILHREDGEPE